MWWETSCFRLTSLTTNCGALNLVEGADFPHTGDNQQNKLGHFILSGEGAQNPGTSDEITSRDNSVEAVPCSYRVKWIKAY